MPSSKRGRPRYPRWAQLSTILMLALGLPFLLVAVVSGAQVSPWYVLIAGLFSERATLAISGSNLYPLLSTEFIQRLLEEWFNKQK
jgi:hypothetical protein